MALNYVCLTEGAKITAVGTVDCTAKGDTKFEAVKLLILLRAWQRFEAV